VIANRVGETPCIFLAALDAVSVAPCRQIPRELGAPPGREAPRRFRSRINQGVIVSEEKNVLLKLDWLTGRQPSVPLAARLM
jgi:hypothetical protein